MCGILLALGRVVTPAFGHSFHSLATVTNAWVHVLTTVNNFRTCWRISEYEAYLALLEELNYINILVSYKVSILFLARQHLCCLNMIRLVWRVP